MDAVKVSVGEGLGSAEADRVLRLSRLASRVLEDQGPPLSSQLKGDKVVGVIEPAVVKDDAFRGLGGELKADVEGIPLAEGRIGRVGARREASRSQAAEVIVERVVTAPATPKLPLTATTSF